MRDALTSNISFGFADVSPADAFEALPEDIKRAVARHADEIRTPEELKRFVERIRRRK